MLNLKQKMNIYASISIFPGSKRFSKGCACMGVDIQAVTPAPIRERLRINVRFLDNAPLSLDPVNEFISLIKPLVEGVR